MGKVAQLAGRIGWKGLTAKEYTKEGPLFLSVHSLNYGDYVDYSDAFHISRTRYDESPEIMLRPNDVLICKDGAGIGKLGIVGNDMPGPTTINSSLLLIRAQEGALPKYLYYILSSPYFQGIVKSRLMGATTPHLYQRDITEFPIYLPPITEQQRIVAILDETFARLVTATANAEKNLRNTRELFDSYLDSTFEFSGADWKETNLSTEVDLLVGFAFKSAQYTKDASGVRLLRGDNVVQNGLRWDGVKRWPVSEVDRYEAYKLQAGDVVLAMDRTWIKAGLKYAVIDEMDMPCLLVQRVARLRCRDHLDSRFLVHLIGSPQFTRYVLDIQTGLSVPHISGKQIGDFGFRKPHIAEQRRIGRAIDELALKVEALEGIYRERLNALSHLKQSVLQKAFSGELTNVAQTEVLSPKAKVVDMKRDTALVIALAYERHKRSNRDKSLGHTKEQKILHMVEAEADFNLGRQPIRDAAGPNDFHHMLAAEEWAEENQYFKVSERDGGGYEFRPLARFRDLLDHANSLDLGARKKIERVIDIFIPMDMQESEVFATTYAAWNNILIQGGTATDDAIIAACYAWHPQKSKIPRAKFVEGLEKIRALNCIPDGRASFVPPPPQGQLPL